ncbi:DUF397 domain-containing protein [Streptomyces sp. NRRL F-2890]|uniref:DUF397 domain-containing protein n=1 Tax=Streptomyces sp. NRRL F-2890 TaxID=1463845 RepID=UPI00099769C2|nr:DUF397 domain-containing protein [Streptomyces sp. NRRL F-2890]
MTQRRLADAPVWRASSYSNASGGQCLEVADGIPDVIPVRDSKCPSRSLTVSSPAWATFVAAVKRGAPW